MDISETLEYYKRLEITCIPLEPKSKKCSVEAWTDRTFTPADFKPGCNIGLLTGKRSQGYMDVDLDWPEAVQIAHYYLPPTQFIFGRPSKPASHLGYRSKAGGTTTVKYQVPGGGIILELRGDGCQTMGPDSIHPSGEPVKIVVGESLGEYDYTVLKRACGQAAAACVLLRNMVGGMRHDLMIAVTGCLLRASWTAEMVVRFLTPVLDHGAASSQARDTILHEIAKLDDKLKAKRGRLPGYTRLKQMLGDTADTVCDWLGLSKSEEYVPRVHTVRTIMDTAFPEPLWVIPGLLPEGVTVLFGRPKSRKSFLALNLALACSMGGKALGIKQTDKHDVLFLALEDSQRRIQHRVLGMSMEGNPLDNLYLTNDWQQGNVDALADWLDEHEGVRFIIIDTWQRFRKTSNSKQSSYQAEYSELQDLVRLCRDRHLAVLLIGHARKSIEGMNQGDLTEMINGSMGIAGAVDCIMGLYWTRGENNAVLKVTGRDVEEQDLMLEWDNTLLCWRAVGDADDFASNSERQQMLDILSDHREVTVKQAMNIVRKSYHATRHLLEALVTSGQVWRDRNARTTTYRLRNRQDGTGEEF